MWVPGQPASGLLCSVRWACVGCDVMENAGVQPRCVFCGELMVSATEYKDPTSPRWRSPMLEAINARSI